MLHFPIPLGSFGTYPKSVREEMRRFQDASEARPDSFIRYEYSSLLDKSREAMGKVSNRALHTLPFLPISTKSPAILPSYLFLPHINLMNTAPQRPNKLPRLRPQRHNRHQHRPAQPSISAWRAHPLLRHHLRRMREDGVVHH